MARSFNDLALATVNACRRQAGQEVLTLAQAVSGGIIEYIPFPDDLAGRYQCFTQANLGILRETGCQHEFLSLEEGVSRYVKELTNGR